MPKPTATWGTPSATRGGLLTAWRRSAVGMNWVPRTPPGTTPPRSGSPTPRPPPSPPAPPRLRQPALDWLRADLAAWHKVLEGDQAKAAPAVRKQLQHWLQDPDFAGVRGPHALAQLPEAERFAWRKLWAEVEALFVQVG